MQSRQRCDPEVASRTLNAQSWITHRSGNLVQEPLFQHHPQTRVKIGSLARDVLVLRDISAQTAVSPVGKPII